MSIHDLDMPQGHTDQALTHLADADSNQRMYNHEFAITTLTTAQIGTGHALLAIGQELAEIRAGLTQISDPRKDVADLTTAVQALTGVLSTAVQPVDLVDVANSVADVRTEVAEVAAAVRELAEAIRVQQQQPRRRWFSRTGADL
ncbi:hypothetical protein [Streptosporangium subroseum]|uniref:hypothetical protein n=1 Tax=Streptosporangium subroseum TaxID=106412 RepID=UPI00308DFB1D|nr:hypothetical protein OHB15_47050 [Streptosporangium subroseum]